MNDRPLFPCVITNFNDALAQQPLPMLDSLVTKGKILQICDSQNTSILLYSGQLWLHRKQNGNVLVL